MGRQEIDGVLWQIRVLRKCEFDGFNKLPVMRKWHQWTGEYNVELASTVIKNFRRNFIKQYYFDNYVFGLFCGKRQKISAKNKRNFIIRTTWEFVQLIGSDDGEKS